MTSLRAALPLRMASQSVSADRLGAAARTGLFLGLALPLVAILCAEAWTMVNNPTIVAMAGSDYRLYMGATARWLAGGPFYLAAQLAGAYTAELRPILYPPPALALFVPFTVLPTALWFAVPISLTAWIMVWQRPSRWGWLAVGATVAAFPMNFLPYLSGTPTIWIVAFLALGTRWPWAAALVLLKPTLLPFALIGVRDRRWWFAAALLLLAGVLMLPLTLEWIGSGANLAGGKSGALYSLENVPVLAVPLIAWLTGHRWALARRKRPACEGGFAGGIL